MTFALAEQASNGAFLLLLMTSTSSTFGLTPLRTILRRRALEAATKATLKNIGLLMFILWAKKFSDSML